MKRHLRVPTGDICIAEGEKGKYLEFLSLGDYGKQQNVKASFLGLDKEIEGVPNGAIMPLEEKWVVTISTQYGCSMGCKFCDAPKVGPGINATKRDLTGQVLSAIHLHPEVLATKRLNIHYARMGEPSFNTFVLEHATVVRKEIYPYIGRSTVHPVVSTMMPKSNKNLVKFLQDWCEIKNDIYKGGAGLQLSINSTSDIQRSIMFNENSLTLKDISLIGSHLPDPKGRKYALNFAISDESVIEAEALKKYFSPKKFMVKITPMHKTFACVKNGISTSDGYDLFTPYKEIEDKLKSTGFDVLVFVPSYEEDLGRITCGNAILSGTLPEVEYEEMEVA